MADAAPDAAAAAGSEQTSREYVLRMALPGEQPQHRFLGSFPLGPPGFRERRGKWTMTEQEPPGPAARGPSSRRQQRPKDWVLEELAFGAAFQGTVEAGISGNGSGSAGAAAGNSSVAAENSGGSGGTAGCYFLLTRRGNDFVAQPVHEWLTFRPTNARTLEEAEAAMASRAAGNGVKAMPRLAELAAAGPADEEAMAGGDQGRDSDAEGGDSDVEGALGRLTTKGSPAGAGAADKKGGGGKDGDRKPTAGRRPAGAGRQRNERGEDWEYEDDRADDDLEMGRDEDADMPAPRRQGEESEEEGPQLSGSSDGDARQPLSTSGAQLQKLLRKTGLDDDASDAEPSSEDATPTPGGTPAPVFADDDMDDEDDEEFLQNMARQEAARQVPVRQPPVAPKAGGLAPKAGGGAVKPAAPAQRGKRKGQADIGDQASTKKAKGSGIATGPAQGALAAADVTPSPDGAAAGPPTQSEIVEWLRTAGPVAVGEVTRRFKKRLTSEAHRKSFGANIKAVATHKEVTPGAGKVVVLRPGV